MVLPIFTHALLRFLQRQRVRRFKSLAVFRAEGREKCISYRPGRDVDLPYSLGRDANVLAFFSAIKVGPLKDIVFPIQGRYRRTFGAESGGAAVAHQWAKLRPSLLKRT